ncbi:MAG: GTPase ObgE [Chloroflexi bacterium]|nr:GTPase ObgE [Chloroflexota bacterium]
MFDRVEITVKGGRGGNGVISFRREKFIPFGGPDGGNGGAGGDVLIRADQSVTDLRRFKPKGVYRAEAGRHGSGNKKQGKEGKDLVLAVPLGTVVSGQTADGAPLFADLEQEGQEAVVAGGGKGGWGNAHFVSSVNQAPQIAQKGAPGEESSLILEMRLIADVGIIGYPNVGKSTLLSAASAARPKIADYPFTTIEPVLGVVELEKGSFTLAEIPGLIEGAHLGRGLGYDFLRHAMRTRMFIHLLDASSASPVEDMIRVNTELGLYAPSLAERPQIVVLNKIDLPGVRSRLAGIEAAFSSVAVSPLSISAATGEGVPGLMSRTMAMLHQLAVRGEAAAVAGKVFRPRPKVSLSVRKEGGVFVLEAPELERFVARGGLTGDEIRWQLRRHFARLGVNKALEKAGIKAGDRVRCGNLEWVW